MIELDSVFLTSENNALNSGLSLEEAKKYIDSIDFSMIINKLIRQYKWLRIEAEEACLHYRRFLYLVKKYGEKHELVPSNAIDEIWHCHIYMNTRKYIKDCQIIFGKYTHHNQAIDEKKERDRLEAGFKLTKDLYHQEFGEHLTTTHFFLKTLLSWFSI